MTNIFKNLWMIPKHFIPLTSYFLSGHLHWLLIFLVESLQTVQFFAVVTHFLHLKLQAFFKIQYNNKN